MGRANATASANHENCRWRIDSREPVNEAPCRRPCCLSFFDGMMMRASVESDASAVTPNSKVPDSLIVPAKTESPVVLSTGMLAGDGCLIDACLTRTNYAIHWHTFAWFHTQQRTDDDSATGTTFQLPSTCLSPEAWSGAMSSSPLMALRARSTARASIALAIAYRP